MQCDTFEMQLIVLDHVLFVSVVVQVNLGMENSIQKDLSWWKHRANQIVALHQASKDVAIAKKISHVLYHVIIHNLCIILVMINWANVKKRPCMMNNPHLVRLWSVQLTATCPHPASVQGNAVAVCSVVCVLEDFETSF